MSRQQIYNPENIGEYEYKEEVAPVHVPVANANRYFRTEDLKAIGNIQKRILIDPTVNTVKAAYDPLEYLAKGFKNPNEYDSNVFAGKVLSGTILNNPLARTAGAFTAETAGAAQTIIDPLAKKGKAGLFVSDVGSAFTGRAASLGGQMEKGTPLYVSLLAPEEAIEFAKQGKFKESGESGAIGTATGIASMPGVFLSAAAQPFVKQGENIHYKLGGIDVVNTEGRFGKRLGTALEAGAELRYLGGKAKKKLGAPVPVEVPLPVGLRPRGFPYTPDLGISRITQLTNKVQQIRPTPIPKNIKQPAGIRPSRPAGDLVATRHPLGISLEPAGIRPANRTRAPITRPRARVRDRARPPRNRLRPTETIPKKNLPTRRTKADSIGKNRRLNELRELKRQKELRDLKELRKELKKKDTKPKDVEKQLKEMEDLDIDEINRLIEDLEKPSPNIDERKMAKESQGRLARLQEPVQPPKQSRPGVSERIYKILEERRKKHRDNVLKDTKRPERIKTFAEEGVDLEPRIDVEKARQLIRESRKPRELPSSTNPNRLNMPKSKPAPEYIPEESFGKTGNSSSSGTSGKFQKPSSNIEMIDAELQREMDYFAEREARNPKKQTPIDDPNQYQAPDLDAQLEMDTAKPREPEITLDDAITKGRLGKKGNIAENIARQEKNLIKKPEPKSIPEPFRLTKDIVKKISEGDPDIMEVVKEQIKQDKISPVEKKIIKNTLNERVKKIKELQELAENTLPDTMNRRNMDLPELNELKDIIEKGGKLTDKQVRELQLLRRRAKSNPIGSELRMQYEKFPFDKIKDQLLEYKKNASDDYRKEIKEIKKDFEDKKITLEEKNNRIKQADMKRMNLSDLAKFPKLYEMSFENTLFEPLPKQERSIIKRFINEYRKSPKNKKIIEDLISELPDRDIEILAKNKKPESIKYDLEYLQTNFIPEDTLTKLKENTLSPRGEILRQGKRQPYLQKMLDAEFKKREALKNRSKLEILKDKLILTETEIKDIKRNFKDLDNGKDSMDIDQRFTEAKEDGRLSMKEESIRDVIRDPVNRKAIDSLVEQWNEIVKSATTDPQITRFLGDFKEIIASNKSNASKAFNIVELLYHKRNRLAQLIEFTDQPMERSLTGKIQAATTGREAVINPLEVVGKIKNFKSDLDNLFEVKNKNQATKESLRSRRELEYEKEINDKAKEKLIKIAEETGERLDNIDLQISPENVDIAMDLMIRTDDAYRLGLKVKQVVDLVSRGIEIYGTWTVVQKVASILGISTVLLLISLAKDDKKK